MRKIGRRTGPLLLPLTVENRMLLPAVILVSMGIILTDCFPVKLYSQDKQIYGNVGCKISGSRRMENENKLETIDNSNSNESGAIYENEIKNKLNEEEFSGCPPDQLTDDYLNGNNSDSETYPLDSKLPIPVDRPMPITEPQTVPVDKFQLPRAVGILKSAPVEIPGLTTMAIPKPTSTENPIWNTVRFPPNIPFGFPELTSYAVAHKSLPFEIPQTLPILISIPRSILISPSAPVIRTIAIPISMSRSIALPLSNGQRSFMLPIQTSRGKSQMISVSMPQIVDQTVSHSRSIIDA